MSIVKNSTADLVYSVEDDYLHCTEALQEMLLSYQYLKSHYNLQKELCLFPFDNPEDYVPHQIYQEEPLGLPQDTGERVYGQHLQ